jgi:hypothetical protein
MPRSIQPSLNADADSEPTNPVAKRQRSSEDDEKGSRRVAQATYRQATTAPQYKSRVIY